MIKPTTLSRESVVRHGLTAYKLTPNNRAYAVTDEVTMALGALTAAYAEQNKERGANGFDPKDVAEKVLAPLARFVPSLVQQRPGSEPEPPKPWIDPVSGQPAVNPHATNPKDFKSIAILEKSDPALNAHLKKIADQGGVTYSMIHEQSEAKAKRDQIRALPYSEKEHATNVFLTNDLTRQNQFVRLVDPAAVEFYRSETRPIELPLSNLTIAGQLAKNAPELVGLWKRAAEIESAWLADDYQAARAQRAAAEAKLEKARAQQGHIAA